MITLYKCYIWNSSGELMESIMGITELLKVRLCYNILVFYNSEHYFIDDV